MEAWDIIVIGDGPAALRAAASAAKAGATTLMMAADSLGSGNGTALDGIAAPLKESTTKSHRDDTIRAGEYLCDQDIVTSRISQATREVDLLERWGVIFRRDSDGVPLVRRAAGHSLPRLAGAGDALSRETQQVLEEQCMKHGVARRGDQVPLELVHTNQEIHGLISLDMTTGSVNALQAKGIIIADGGYEGIWSGTSIGLGLDLALRSGLAVRNLEFMAWAPLAVTGTNVVLPIGMLADGASLHHSNGTPLDVDQFADTTRLANAIGYEGAVLDSRNLNDSEKWWAQTSEILSTRLGINSTRQTIPVTAQVSTTLGGVVTDEFGRAISGKWSRWFTGLYAAGESACSGVHGAGLIAGNRLLDALAGGAVAGEHAAEHAAKAPFTGRAALETYLGVVEADLDFDMAGTDEGPVQRSAPLFATLVEIMKTHVGASRNESGLQSAIEQLTELETAAEKLHLDDNSRLFNTNLLEALRLKAGIRLAKATTQSAISRTESRGTHQRSDFEDTDPNQLHHTLVDNQGNTSKLAIRKGGSATWVLSPDA
ncbi:MAG: FAD-binding protein [Euryarchaeota archaeon]|nr:FAD-binding protein [Euryarchaeota archaeon]MBT5184377.1 FAD-binding protein [Euryarchaeota archaeon]